MGRSLSVDIFFGTPITEEDEGLLQGIAVQVKEECLDPDTRALLEEYHRIYTEEGRLAGRKYYDEHEEKLSAHYTLVREKTQEYWGPISPQWAGLSDYMTAFIMIRESNLSIYGNYGSINPVGLNTNPEWGPQLRDFIEKTGITVQQCGWLVTASYN